ncbi:hypothetical protein EV182_004456 [Spiromyces aspiralis]|uniref:Uncharacterized protein n=1 Tax=Spiromyces aspiralis TaxID=68401 RepID=A0ACC1HWJ3_9FUNG|nr:hypothetical protein EV182_004456 [Spiromyces aspiralis]
MCNAAYTSSDQVQALAYISNNVDISGTESSDYIFIPRPSESDYISNTTQSWSAASQQLSPHASNDESTYEARTSGWADSDDGSRFAAPSDSPVLPPSQNWRSTQSDYFRWIAIPKLSRAFFAPQVLERVGTPVSFLIKDNFIVGTNMGKVVICDAQAQVKAIVGSRELDNLLVSSIAMSADNTSLLVGYSDGRLIAWDWKANSPTVTCEPRDLRDTHRPNTKSSPCCHPTGVPITHVAFIGVSKHRFVSGDAMGHAIYHHIIRRVVVTSVKSELLLPLANNSHIRINSLADLSADPLAETAGGDEEEEEDAGSNVSDLPCLYALASLPYGTLEHTTDHIGLVAAISGEKVSRSCCYPSARRISCGSG